MTHYFQTISKTKRYSVNCYTSKTRAGHLPTARKLWSLLHEYDIWLIIIYLFFSLNGGWYALTSSRLLFLGKTLWSRSTHSSLWFGMSWEYWDKVNRKRWWSSAAQPHSLKRSPTQKTCDHLEGKMNKRNKVSHFCSFHFYKPNW